MTDILVNRSIENEEELIINENILNKSDVLLNEISSLEKDEHKAIIEDHTNSDFSSHSLNFTDSILLLKFNEYFKLKFKVFIFL